MAGKEGDDDGSGPSVGIATRTRTRTKRPSLYKVLMLNDDYTKAWLDQGWIAKESREQMMLNFLMDPENNARTFGSNRKMPDLDISQQEAEAVIAFLKWMSAIDTNGFPHNFIALGEGE
jgi:hypothetical protein